MFDETASAPNSDSNQYSFSQHSFQSITWSLYNHAVAKGILPNSNKKPATNQAQTSTDEKYNFNSSNPTLSHFGHSALKRRLED